MSKYHINQKGVPALCRAQGGKCPFAEHFPTEQEAQKFADEVNASEAGLLPGLSDVGKSATEIKLTKLAESGEFWQLRKEMKQLENIEEFEGVNNYINSLKGNKNALDKKVSVMKGENSALEKKRKEIGQIGRKRKNEEIDRLTLEHRSGQPVLSQLNKLKKMPKNAPLNTSDEKLEIQKIAHRQSEINSNIGECNQLERGQDLYLQSEYKEKMAHKRIEGKLQNLKFKPDLDSQTIEKNYDKIVEVENTITNGLKDNENFESLRTIRNGDEISIQGKHKQVNGFMYGRSVKLDANYSNHKEASELFVKQWKQDDNEQSLKQYKDFIGYGSRSNWN